MDRRQFVGLTGASMAAWLADQRAPAAAAVEPQARRTTFAPEGAG